MPALAWPGVQIPCPSKSPQRLAVGFNALSQNTGECSAEASLSLAGHMKPATILECVTDCEAEPLRGCSYALPAMSDCTMAAQDCSKTGGPDHSCSHIQGLVSTSVWSQHSTQPAMAPKRKAIPEDPAPTTPGSSPPPPTSISRAKKPKAAHRPKLPVA